MKKKRFIKIINKLKSGRLLDQDEFKDSIDLIKKIQCQGAPRGKCAERGLTRKQLTTNQFSIITD